jgi:hypothetical protein
MAKYSVNRLENVDIIFSLKERYLELAQDNNNIVR